MIDEYKWFHDCNDSEKKVILEIQREKYLQYGLVAPPMKQEDIYFSKIALSGGIPVGFFELYKTSKAYNIYEINSYGVLKDHRGKGLGKKIVKEALRVCKEEKNSSHVFAWVILTEDGKYSEKVLESCGFEKYAEDVYSGIKQGKYFIKL